jgi:uncharacterized RDD family membrane protein YckC
MTALAIAPIQEKQAPLRRAGLVSRATADVIDFVVVGLVFALVLLGIALARYLLGNGPFELPRPNIGVSSTAEYLLLVVYLAWGWASTGRTPGKALLGLRVVTARGERLHPSRAIARAVICALFPIFLAWVLVSRKNAGIHDLLLGTTVVYDWRPRTAPRSGAAD